VGVRISSRLHPEWHAPAEATLGRLTDDYPDVELSELTLFDRPGDLSLGHCDPRRIILNAYWFSQPRSFFEEATLRARSVAPPWAPPWHGRIGGISHEFDRLLTHEFGHLLMDALGEPAEEFAERGFVAAVVDPTGAVSGYSLVDPHEWFAETFAGMRFGRSGPWIDRMAALIDGLP
jgi:hypothetical protein